MSTGYPGGLVTKSPTATVGAVDSGFGPEGGTASGIWTVDQAAALKQQGLWPAKTKTKRLYAMGYKYGTGQNDHTDAATRSSPVQIGTDTSWTKVAAGGNHWHGIKSDGTLYAWGFNNEGQLGLNTYGYGGSTSRSSPTQVGTLTTWKEIHAQTGEAVAAIKTDGSLWCWGGGYSSPGGTGTFGKNGDNTIIGRSSPVQVGVSYDWAKVTTVSKGVLSIKTDGTLWSFGYNSQGQLGLNTTAHRSSPVQVGTDTNWSIIDGGASSWCAIKTNGTLWSCGYGSFGQLGNNGTDNKSAPVQIGALTTWAACGQGGRYGSAIRTDGTLWSWGVIRVDSYGVLGINLVDDTVSGKSSPVQVGTDTNWSKVFCNDQITIAIKTDGTMWSWGSNSEGANGTNTNIHRSSPVQIGAGTNWGIAVPGRTSLAIEAS